MINILTRLFGSRNERLLKQYAQQVREINALEPAIAALADEELRQKTVELRTRVTGGAALDDVLPEAFAVVREAGKRTLNMITLRSTPNTGPDLRQAAARPSAETYER